MTRRFLFIFLILFFLGLSSYSVAGEFDHAHTRLTLVLQKIVKDGKVDYVMLVRDSSELERYLKELGKIRKGQYENFTKSRKMAYWINLYNGTTILAISRNYPVFNKTPNPLYPKSSVRQIPGIWNKMRFKTALGYKTLNQIEAEQLESFNEPLLYFAIVSSAVSGPKIMPEAIIETQMESQLREAARNFVLDAGNVRADPNTKTLYLNRIFKWKGKGFIPKYFKTGHFAHRTKSEIAVLNFLGSYAGMMEKMMIYRDDFEIKYMEFDWSLNER